VLNTACLTNKPRYSVTISYHAITPLWDTEDLHQKLARSAKLFEEAPPNPPHRCPFRNNKEHLTIFYGGIPRGSSSKYSIRLLLTSFFSNCNQNL